MNPKRGVEVRLRRSRLHRNGQPLDDLRSSVAGHVAAHDEVVRGVDDELHNRVLFALTQREFEWGEDGLVHANILAAVRRVPARFDLQTLLTYIMTHELIHIVRFERFQHPFQTSPADRVREEERVHALTYDILVGLEGGQMAALLEYYRTHRMPRCL